jgi:hypothetical protein
VRSGYRRPLLSENRPAFMREEGRRLIQLGEALIDRALELEGDEALGAIRLPEPVRTGATHARLYEVARDLCSRAWVSAGVLAARTGHDVRLCGVTLSRLVQWGELEKRKVPGFTTDYRLKQEKER